jgi:hypothetical protein
LLPLPLTVLAAVFTKAPTWAAASWAKSITLSVRLFVRVDVVRLRALLLDAFRPEVTRLRRDLVLDVERFI